MSEFCNCCDGIAKSVPVPLAQRPGLHALNYRIGRHATFRESLIACLTNQAVTLAVDEISSWIVEPHDIDDPARLRTRLESGKDNAVEFLWSQFSADDQIGLDGTPDEALAILVDRLNSIVRGASIYTEARFAHLVLEPSLLALTEELALTGLRLEQQNRRLVDAALEPHIRERQKVYPLDRLTTRDSGDFSIALLDAFAVVADITTFYQERFANEGYLRTATERRSILELARLIGYEPRSGVSASAFLAFTLEDGHEVEIATGTRVQSTPEPGGLPQPFETSEPLAARSEWNLLQVRMKRPQRIIRGNVRSINRLYLAGTATGLKKNDVLLLAFDPRVRVLRRVAAVEPDEAAERTLVRLQSDGVIQAPAPINEFSELRATINAHRDLSAFNVDSGATASEVLEILDGLELLLDSGDTITVATATRGAIERLSAMLDVANAAGHTRLAPWLESLVNGLRTALRSLSAPDFGTANGHNVDKRAVTMLGVFSALGLGDSLSRQRSLQPANRQRLDRSISATFAPSADTLPRLLTYLQPAYANILYPALGAANVQDLPVQVYAFRMRASLYGHNAPELARECDPETSEVRRTGDPDFRESATVIDLAQPNEDILPGSWVVVRQAGTSNEDDPSNTFALAGEPNSNVSRADYGISGQVTRINLLDPANPANPVTWYDSSSEPDFNAIRTATVYAQAERLELAEEPVLDKPTGDTLRPVSGMSVELGPLYQDLEPGRWLIVTGEREDIENVTGVTGAELVMLAGVEHGADLSLPGDKLHTRIVLAGSSESEAGLAYKYKRDTVRIYGNVVKSTHGESVSQVLGSGDGSKVLQSFELSRPPVTHVSAPTPAGAEAELEVRINGVLWDRRQSLVELGEGERGYIMRTDDEGVTSVTFGDGHFGARLPSGAENVSAGFRTKLGLDGNVDARRIDMLMERPLGVKEVINPIEASGGADRENRDQARDNAPLAILALDRLVSVQDYADFAHTFAGIAKATAELLPDGRRRVLHLTVAVAADGVLDRNGDLYRNLLQALADFGDPSLALQIDARILRLVVMHARVRVDAAYRWEDVEPVVRQRLEEQLGFERRELGRGVALSEAIATIQSTPGVDYVDVDIFDAVDEDDVIDNGDLAESLRRRPVLPARPAQIEGMARRILPADLVYLNPEVPDTLLLEELPR